MRRTQRLFSTILSLSVAVLSYRVYNTAVEISPCAPCIRNKEPSGSRKLSWNLETPCTALSRPGDEENCDNMLPFRTNVFLFPLRFFIFFLFLFNSLCAPCFVKSNHYHGGSAIGWDRYAVFADEARSSVGELRD